MDEIRKQFLADLGKADSLKAVEEVRIRYLGRKGAITTLMKNTDFSQLTPDQRRDFGRQLNELKTFAEAEVARAVEAAKLKPVVDSVYALTDVREAAARMESGGQFGKIVLRSD